MTASPAVRASGALTVSDGTFAPADGSSFGDVDIAAGATLDGSGGTLRVSGDWTNDGEFTPGTGTVAFDGDAAQAIGGSEATTFHALIIENSGSAPVTASPPITVTGDLTVADGTFSPESGSHFSDVEVESGGALILPPGGGIIVDGELNNEGTSNLRALDVALDGAGRGATLAEPAGTIFAAGTVVTLTAQPGAHSRFTGWGGALEGATSPVTLTMDADTAITVTFELNQIMEVLGNGQVITSGDTLPAAADHTDFGQVLSGGAAVTRTFTISNSGGLALRLTGAPLVALSGPAAADFSVVSVPTSTVAISGATSFQLSFRPTAVGVRAATVTIASDDPETPAYSFVVQGEGLRSEGANIVVNSTPVRGPLTSPVVTLTVILHNMGPGDAGGTHLLIPRPASGVTSIAWQCQARGGAACPAASGTLSASARTSGQTGIDQTLATFPANGKLIYTMVMQLTESRATVSTQVIMDTPEGVKNLNPLDTVAIGSYILLVPQLIR